MILLPRRFSCLLLAYACSLVALKGQSPQIFAPPTVTSVSPPFGPEAGGTAVQISGTGFTGATQVSFGGNSANFTVVSATRINATAPAGTAGTVDVTVKVASLTSATGSADQYTYVAAPTVTGLNPASGLTSGGTSVTITGTNFAGTTEVKFGTVDAQSFVVNSPTAIQAQTPTENAGTVDVTVTTGGGTSAVNAGDRFTYFVLPTVSSVSPSTGPVSGGTTVTITGTNFVGASAVLFGNTGAVVFSVSSPTQIIAESPAGQGTVDVTVTANGETSATSSADQFTYVAAPTVTAVSPAAGPQAGGTSVTIAGTNFVGATGVHFGGTLAAAFTVDSPTQITATSPAGAGTVDITVTTSGGTSATSVADQYTYVAAPTVTAVQPNGGPTAGGTSVTITGTHFTGATAVKFGARDASAFTVNSPTQITATSPLASPGTVDITVTTAGGTSATGPQDQYFYLVPPQITIISPPGGPTYGGTTVTITGGNLSSAGAVHFGTRKALRYTVLSSTQITAISPPGCGLVDITVSGSGGTSPTSPGDQFAYLGNFNTIAGLEGELAQALGTSAAATDVNADGAIDVVDLQTMIGSYLGLPCGGTRTAPGATTAGTQSGAPGAGASIVDIGTPGGPGGRAFGIDNLGMIVGESGAACRANTCGVGHAFLWGPEGEIGLGDIAGAAYAVNDLGQVAGTVSGPAGHSAAFVYRAGTAAPLSGLPGGSAKAINLRGQVAGDFSPVPARGTHAFLWTEGAWIDLGGLGGDSAHANAVNGLGEVAGAAALPGNAAFHAFSYSSSRLSDLGTLGGRNSEARGMNDIGQIAGVAETADGARHAFLYERGAMQDLGTLGGQDSQADAVNNRGEIVGWAMAADGRRHAFLWTAGTMLDLNTFGTIGDGAVLEEATALNDLGQVVANGSNGSVYLVTLPADR